MKKIFFGIFILTIAAFIIGLFPSKISAQAGACTQTVSCGEDPTSDCGDGSCQRDCKHYNDTHTDQLDCLKLCCKVISWGKFEDFPCILQGGACAPNCLWPQGSGCLPPTEPTPTPSPGATPTEPPSTVGTCGNCDCGFPIAECYNSPDFGCVHDPNCVGQGPSASCNVRGWSPSPFSVKKGESAVIHATVKTENSGGFWWPCSTNPNDTIGCYGLLVADGNKNATATRKPLNGCVLTSGQPRGTGYWDCTFGVSGTNYNGTRDQPVDLTLDVYVTGKNRSYGDGDCNGRVTITSLAQLVPQSAWWQAADGDVITNGDLITPISILCGELSTSRFCQPQLMRDFTVVPVRIPDPNDPDLKITVLRGTGDNDGVASYGTSYSFLAGFGSGSASAKGWLAKTFSNIKIYDYSYFASNAPGSLNDVGAENIASSSLASGGTAINGYVWYKRVGNLTLNGDVTFSGGRKVILMVDGELTIKGKVLASAPGSDFFMTIAHGNINIDPAVFTVYDQNFVNPATLQGIYVTDGLFKTGVGDQQFSLKGSVIALSGIKFERNIGDNGNTMAPSDFVQFDPAMTYAIPHDFYKTSIIWREVAP